MHFTYKADNSTLGRAPWFGSSERCVVSSSHRTVGHGGPESDCFGLLQVALRAKCLHEHVPELASQKAVEEEIRRRVDCESCLPCVEQQGGGHVAGRAGGEGRYHVDCRQNAADEEAQRDSKNDVGEI